MSKTEYKNQNGLVSIIIVTVVISILALMTIGFARVTDRELRQSLDRKLGSQANYAAESGLNDARAYIADKIATGGDPSTSGNCLDTQNPASLPAQFVRNGSISGKYNSSSTDNLIRYTCVIINSKPSELTYKIPAGQSKIFKVVPDGGNLENLYFSWENADGSTGFLPGGSPPVQLPTEAQMNGKTGVLRSTIYSIPLSAATSKASDVQNTDLANASRTFFFYPNSSASAGLVNTVPTTSNGAVTMGNCNIGNDASPSPVILPNKQATPRYCNSKVTGLYTPPPPPSAVPATSVRVTGQLEGHRGFRNITMRFVAREGAQTATIFSQTYNPNTFDPAAGSGSCTQPGDAGQGQLDFGITSSLPPGFTNPNIEVYFDGFDDWNVAGVPGDNNVIVDSVHITYGNGAIGIAHIVPNFLGEPYRQCAPGFSTWRNSNPPSIPAPGPDLNAPLFYYVRLTALYSTLNVSIQGSTGISGPEQSVKIKEAQAVVDVTAQGNDVLKRLQARVGLTPEVNYDYPNYALQSMDTLCKRLRLPQQRASSDPNPYGTARIDDPPGGGTDVACQPQN
jgi:Tfp pilus assembly protein PilX